MTAHLSATEVVNRGSDHPKINATEVAIKYAQDVLADRLIAGKLVKYAAKRFLEDLTACNFFGTATEADPRARGLHYVPEMAQRVVDFFGFLKHNQGEWGNQTFVLEPWQVFVLANLFGWYHADGTRRFTEAYIEVARKNGKTTFLAGIGLYLLLMDNEPGAEVYSAATTKEQARICFKEAAHMRAKSPFLAKRIEAFGAKQVNQLFVKATASKYLPLSSEDNTLDGLNIHGCLIDELHAHPDRRLYDVLFEATKARRSPLVVAITTAGYDRSDASICWNKRGRAESILQGVLCNQADGWKGDNVFAFIACLDEKDDYFDERNWPKANPSLAAGIVKIRGLREAADEAKADPTALNSFLRKHMNVWTSQETKWMDPEKWAASSAVSRRNTDLGKVRDAAIEALKGRKCFAGIDISSKLDLTAYVLVFPPTVDDSRYHVLGWYWVPELNVPERVKRDNVPYDVWIHQGYLNTTDGNVVDQQAIRNRIKVTKSLFQIEEAGYDAWNNTQLSLELASDGIKVVETRQGYKTFSEPMKETMALTLAKKIEHYADPILAWAMNNMVATSDPAGNIKPDKEKAKEKIDPGVAMLMAMARIISKPVTVSNPYNERGIIFI